MADETSKIAKTVSNLIEKAETTLDLINDTNVKTKQSLQNAEIEKKKEEERKAATEKTLQKKKDNLDKQRY